MKREARYSIKNPLVTEEDIADHESVGGVILHTGKIFVLWHNKYKYLTIPVGKVKTPQTLYEALKEEVREEVGIRVEAYRLLSSFEEDYDRDDGVITHTKQFIFEIISWVGDPHNAEPDKHDFARFMSLDEIYGYVDRSDILNAYLEYIES